MNTSKIRIVSYNAYVFNYFLKVKKTWLKIRLKSRLFSKILKKNLKNKNVKSVGHPVFPGGLPPKY